MFIYKKEERSTKVGYINKIIGKILRNSLYLLFIKERRNNPPMTSNVINNKSNTRSISVLVDLGFKKRLDEPDAVAQDIKKTYMGIKIDEQINSIKKMIPKKILKYLLFICKQ